MFSISHQANNKRVFAKKSVSSRVITRQPGSNQSTAHILVLGEKVIFCVLFFFHVFLEIVVLTVENFLPVSSVFIIKYLDRMLFFPNSLQEWQMRRGRSKVCTDVYFLIWLEQRPGHRGEQLNLKYRCNTRNGTVDIWINLPTLPTNMKTENSLSLCW